MIARVAVWGLFEVGREYDDYTGSAALVEASAAIQKSSAHGHGLRERSLEIVFNFIRTRFCRDHLVTH